MVVLVWAASAVVMVVILLRMSKPRSWPATAHPAIHQADTIGAMSFNPWHTDSTPCWYCTHFVGMTAQGAVWPTRRLPSALPGLLRAVRPGSARWASKTPPGSRPSRCWQRRFPDQSVGEVDHMPRTVGLLRRRRGRSPLPAARPTGRSSPIRPAARAAGRRDHGLRHLDVAGQAHLGQGCRDIRVLAACRPCSSRMGMGRSLARRCARSSAVQAVRVTMWTFALTVGTVLITGAPNHAACSEKPLSEWVSAVTRSSLISPFSIAPLRPM